MSEIKDGGPAFPLAWRTAGTGDANEGMSLRDWFAGQALSSLMASDEHGLNFLPEDDAKYCYQIADAMLAEREKSK